MITKAIVDKIIDRYSIRVRVPSLDRTAQSSIYTNSEDLDVALVCTLPGCDPNIKVGDVVFVSIDDMEEDRVVILGYLYRTKQTETYCDMILSKLQVRDSANLPYNTTIGNVSSFELNQLEGLNENIQKQLLALREELTVLKDRVSLLEERN